MKLSANKLHEVRHDVINLDNSHGATRGENFINPRFEIYTTSSHKEGYWRKSTVVFEAGWLENYPRKYPRNSPLTFNVFVIEWAFKCAASIESQISIVLSDLKTHSISNFGSSHLIPKIFFSTSLSTYLREKKLKSIVEVGLDVEKRI